MRNEYNHPELSNIKIRYGDDPRIADCCLPIPQDETTAILTGEGVVEVHRSSCNDLYAKAKDSELKKVVVDWFVNADDVPSFKARIAITVQNVAGVIAKITATLAREGVDIRSFDMVMNDNGQAKLISEVIVRNRRELYLLARVIRKLDACVNVERVLNK